MKSKRSHRLTTGAATIESVREGNWTSGIQLAGILSRSVAEFYICARPESFSFDFGVQARSAYRNLRRTLENHGIKTRDIITEKIFFSDIQGQLSEFQKIRHEFYSSEMESGESLPATTYVQQPPARPGHSCEIQVFTTTSTEGSGPGPRGIPDPPPGVSGKVIQIGGIRHVYLANVTGRLTGDPSGFSRQVTSMFQRAEACLSREGLSFRDVLRTWIYIRDIDEDYDAFNLARNDFFNLRGIRPAPASTGIQGLPSSPDLGCSMDLRAASGNGKIRVQPIHSPTMNEAPSYGSAFSRGTRLELEDRTILYLSGTASIDGEGRVVHAGDIEGQVERMLLNIQQLLAGQGAGNDHLVSATTYLKRREFLEPFRNVCRQRGFPEEIPNTICVADVCRPEWLCEMEATAVMT